MTTKIGFKGVPISATVQPRRISVAVAPPVGTRVISDVKIKQAGQDVVFRPRKTASREISAITRALPITTSPVVVTPPPVVRTVRFQQRRAESTAGNILDRFPGVKFRVNRARAGIRNARRVNIGETLKGLIPRP